MNEKINCETAEALMPLVLDGEASAPIAQTLQAHLAACDNCRAVYDTMKADAPAERVDVDAAKIFKKTRRKLRRRIITLVLALCVVFSGLWVFFNWYSVASVLKADDYSVDVEPISIDDFLLLDIGGGDYLAHVQDADEDAPWSQPFLLKAADYEKLQANGCAYGLCFFSAKGHSMDHVDIDGVEDGKLRVFVWSDHNVQFLSLRHPMQYRLVFDPFTSIYNVRDEKAPTDVTWYPMEKIAGRDEPVSQ